MIRSAIQAWLGQRRARQARRARGDAGEARVASVLNAFAREFGLAVHHRVPLVTASGRRGDLDHVLVVGSPPIYLIAIETKAERPDVSHLLQVDANADRASRRHFKGLPQYRVVVHPNSSEKVEFDPVTRAARMGLPELPAYLHAILRGNHPDRLSR